MINKIIDTITSVGKGIFLLMMFGAIVLFSIAAMFPEQFKVEEEAIQDQGPDAVKALIRAKAIEFNVPPLLALAVAQKESNFSHTAYRFEPSQMGRAAKFTKNKEQQRMLASSHCFYQVMGYRARELNISWPDLYDTDTCIMAGLTLLKKAIDRHKEKSKYERYRRALGEYNGSLAYADDVMNKLGKQLIDENL